MPKSSTRTALMACFNSMAMLCPATMETVGADLQVVLSARSAAEILGLPADNEPVVLAAVLH